VSKERYSKLLLLFLIRYFLSGWCLPLQWRCDGVLDCEKPLKEESVSALSLDRRNVTDDSDESQDLCAKKGRRADEAKCPKDTFK